MTLTLLIVAFGAKESVVATEMQAGHGPVWLDPTDYQTSLGRTTFVKEFVLPKFSYIWDTTSGGRGHSPGHVNCPDTASTEPLYYPGK